MTGFLDFLERWQHAILFVFLLFVAFELGVTWGSREVTSALQLTAETQGQLTETLEDLRTCRIDSIRYEAFRR